MSDEKRAEKGRRAAITRMQLHPDIGNKISDSLKKKPGRKVSIDGVIYDKCRIAAETLGIKYVTLKARIRFGKWPTWFYVD
jgi:hypothetical protein